MPLSATVTDRQIDKQSSAGISSKLVVSPKMLECGHVNCYWCNGEFRYFEPVISVFDFQQEILTTNKTVKTS